MNKKISLMALSCAVFLGLASCNSSDNDEAYNEMVLTGYFTITGSSPNYKLIEDGGTIVYPTMASVSEVTKGAGFGYHKRVYLNILFNKDNVTQENGADAIHYANLQSGAYLIEMPAITKDEATEAGIMVEDSIFKVKSISNCWLANGYLTSLFTAEYSIVNGVNIDPDANLCATSTDENAVTLTLLYNRHTAKTGVNYDEGNYAYSFDISKLNIPGSDSVTVTLEIEGTKTTSCKISRNAFQKIQ